MSFPRTLNIFSLQQFIRFTNSRWTLTVSHSRIRGLRANFYQRYSVSFCFIQVIFHAQWTNNESNRFPGFWLNDFTVHTMALGAIREPRTYGNDAGRDRSRVVYGSPAPAEVVPFLGTERHKSLRIQPPTRYSSFVFRYLRPSLTNTTLQLRKASIPKRTLRHRRKAGSACSGALHSHGID